jgi:hypothetical protein
MVLRGVFGKKEIVVSLKANLYQLRKNGVVSPRSKLLCLTKIKRYGYCTLKNRNLVLSYTNYGIVQAIVLNTKKE